VQGPRPRPTATARPTSRWPAAESAGLWGDRAAAMAHGWDRGRAPCGPVVGYVGRRVGGRGVRGVASQCVGVEAGAAAAGIAPGVSEGHTGSGRQALQLRGAHASMTAMHTRTIPRQAPAHDRPRAPPARTGAGGTASRVPGARAGCVLGPRRPRGRCTPLRPRTLGSVVWT